MTLGGWCQVAPGTVHTERQHVGCRSKVCECQAFGGHEKTPDALVLSGSGRSGRVNFEKQSGPDQRELIEAHRPLVRSDRQ